MKKRLTFATSLSTTGLFLILSSVKIPFMVLAAFTLLLYRGIGMYQESTSEIYELNEDQPKGNIPKLIVVRFVLQLIPIMFMGICFYLLYWRREIWLPFFR